MLQAIREVLLREVPELGTLKIYRLSHAINDMIKDQLRSLFRSKPQTRTHRIADIDHPTIDQAPPEHTVGYEDERKL